MAHPCKFWTHHSCLQIGYVNRYTIMWLCLQKTNQTLVVLQEKADQMLANKHYDPVQVILVVKTASRKSATKNVGIRPFCGRAEVSYWEQKIARGVSVFLCCQIQFFYSNFTSVFREERSSRKPKSLRGLAFLMSFCSI